jgi:3-methyladenine DNA glycosylase/8-oxoguanine DNA glycosylase
MSEEARAAAERMRERCEEAINDILNGGLYHGPYPEQVCDIIAGVLESCKEKIRTLELEEY